MHYKYTGTVQISVPGIGVVDPGQTVETDMNVNHPLFQEQQLHRNIDQQPQTERTSKSRKGSKIIVK